MRLAVVVLKPPLTAFTRRDWRGREHIPATGGVLLVANHISYLDPMTLAHFVYDAGRLPRFLAKDSVFRLPVAGRIVRGAGQIPVQRYTQNAAKALQPATEALRRGECVVIYPEGTVTRDPMSWPMRAHTGLARLAIDTGAPVIPIGQWGVHEMLGLDKRPHLLPRHTVHMLAGPPVDLAAYAGLPPTARVLREVTDLVMRRVRELVGDLRGEVPPADVYDARRLAPVAEDDRRSA